MEFDIKNKKENVEINITFRCGYAGQYIYTFTHNAGRVSSAGLIAEAVHDQFSDHVERIRREAYNEGWEDKKKRRTKRTDFYWCPNVIKMERY